MSTLYELYGILIHSGSAMGGHYHAYIKDVIATPDPAKCDDASAGWSDYNDSQVSPIDLPTLERMMCGTATAAASAPAAPSSQNRHSPHESLPAQTALASLTTPHSTHPPAHSSHSRRPPHHPMQPHRRLSDPRGVERDR